MRLDSTAAACARDVSLASNRMSRWSPRTLPESRSRTRPSSPAQADFGFANGGGHKKLPTALYLAKQAAAIRPGDAGTLYTLGRAYTEAGQYEQAVGALEATLAFRPDEPLILYHLAVAKYEAGAVSEARSGLERALQLDPEFREAPRARTLLERIESPPEPAS